MPKPNLIAPFFIAGFILLYCTLLIMNPVAAKAPVWEVSHGDNRFYLAGTIHLLSSKDYPLPVAFDVAYEQSQSIVFETDLSVAGAANTQAQLLPTIISTDGTTLESRLNTATFDQFKTFLNSRKLALPMFEMLTPAGVNLSLLAIELQKLGINGENGVETHFNARARKDKKDISWLESIEEQIEALNKMNEVDPNLMVSSTLDDLEKLPETWPILVKNWRDGDMKSLGDIALDSMLESAPELYDALIINRNNNWIPAIKQMLKTPETELILVGALHLTGEHSILKLLDMPGLQVRQLD